VQFSVIGVRALKPYETIKLLISNTKLKLSNFLAYFHTDEFVACLDSRLRGNDKVNDTEGIRVDTLAYGF
jgi:hypothetical protein